MNKLEILKKFFDGKEITRQINNFVSDDDKRKNILNIIKHNKIPLSELKEDEKAFTFRDVFCTKNKYPKITIANLKVKSTTAIFGNCTIQIKDIKEISPTEFKTEWATYYIGSE